PAPDPRHAAHLCLHDDPWLVSLRGGCGGAVAAALDLPGSYQPGPHVLVLVGDTRAPLPRRRTAPASRGEAAMSRLAPTLQAYSPQRLIGQLRVSPNTAAAYRDAWRLLLQFVQAEVGKEPSELDITDPDAPTIVAFLDHLEQERHNGIRTRNARLSAVR